MPPAPRPARSARGKKEVPLKRVADDDDDIVESEIGITEKSAKRIKKDHLENQVSIEIAINDNPEKNVIKEKLLNKKDVEQKEKPKTKNARGKKVTEKQNSNKSLPDIVVSANTLDEGIKLSDKENQLENIVDDLIVDKDKPIFVKKGNNTQKNVGKVNSIDTNNEETVSLVEKNIENDDHNLNGKIEKPVKVKKENKKPMKIGKVDSEDIDASNEGVIQVAKKVENEVEKTSNVKKGSKSQKKTVQVIEDNNEESVHQVNKKSENEEHNLNTEIVKPLKGKKTAKNQKKIEEVGIKDFEHNNEAIPLVDDKDNKKGENVDDNLNSNIEKPSKGRKGDKIQKKIEKVESEAFEDDKEQMVKVNKKVENDNDNSNDKIEKPSKVKKNGKPQKNLEKTKTADIQTSNEEIIPLNNENIAIVAKGRKIINDTEKKEYSVLSEDKEEIGDVKENMTVRTRRAPKKNYAEETLADNQYSEKKAKSQRKENDKSAKKDKERKIQIDIIEEEEEEVITKVSGPKEVDPKPTSKVKGRKTQKKDKEPVHQVESIPDKNKNDGFLDKEDKPPAKKGKEKKEKPVTEESNDNDEDVSVETEHSTKQAAKGKRAAPKETTSKEINHSESAGEPAPKKNKSEDKKPALKNKATTSYEEIDFSNTSKNPKGDAWNLKICSWNVDGIRSWLSKGGLDYIKHEKPDILCLQETKCAQDKLPKEVTSIPGYHPYWLCSDQDGYAGVGIYTTKMAINVQYGLQDEDLDSEGRIITAEYEQFYLICTYVPNAGRKLVTLPKRLKWNEAFHSYVKRLDEKKPVIICGDMNVAHKEIDLANPKTNKKNAGFTIEEREGMTKLLADGFVDTYRHLRPEQTGAYTFWTYMMNSRAKNVGWRLDYMIMSERLLPTLCDHVIRDQVFGSDHCPITLFLHLSSVPKIPKE